MDGKRDRPTIRAYGFIESVTMPKEPEHSRGRVNIVIDGIRIEAISSGMVANTLDSDLLIVRILSTIKRLDDRFPDAEWEEGSWLELELGDSPGDPPVWILSAENGYSGSVERLNITEATSLAGNPFSPSPLEQKLINFCQTSNAVRIDKPRRPTRRYRGQGPFVRVVDVGQASFSVLHRERKIGSPVLGYFDVGGPLFFHGKSFPKTFNESSKIPASGFVVLSHWDFDHYSLAVSKLPKLRELNWYAPDQPVGPNAAALQNKLGAKLTLLSVPSYGLLPGIQLWKGQGARSNRNESGYVLKITRTGGDVLLCGDLPYSQIPAGIGTQFDAIAITHHGGAATGAPPFPSPSGGIAAVSYGKPNRYHHPDPASIDLHQSAGWSVSPTYLTAKLRGDVWL